MFDKNLKACPFCDSTAFVKKMEDGGYAVFCDVCECSLGDYSYGGYHIDEGENFGAFKSEEDAVETWNQRGKK